jgi:replicative DNA helicase
MANIKSEESLNGLIPPQAIELEVAVLGALIIDNDSYYRIDEILTEAVFYKCEHQIIFGIIKDLHIRDRKVDLLTVSQALGDTAMNKIGGFLFLTELTNKILTSAHIEHHARIIVEKYLRRQVLSLTYEIQKQAFDDSIDVDDLLTNFSNEVDGLNMSFIGINSGKTSAHVSSVSIKEIEEDCKKAESGDIAGIPTGFHLLNKHTGGWRSPNFIILAARPGVGKTSLMLHFAITAARAGFWVNIYGYEMLAEDLFRIVLSGESRVGRTKIRDGKLDNSDWKDIQAAKRVLEKLPIIWYDNSQIKANQIKSITNKNMKAGKCDIIFVDYLQIIPPEDERVNRELQIAKISRLFKSISVTSKIPVMALAQLNRDIDKRQKGAEPLLADLRESGSLEQDSDIVIFPYRDENDNMVLKIAKHRRGICGTLPIGVNDEMTRFFDNILDHKNLPY